HPAAPPTRPPTPSLHDALPISQVTRAIKVGTAPGLDGHVRHQRRLEIAFLVFVDNGQRLQHDNATGRGRCGGNDFRTAEVANDRDRKSTRLNSSHVKTSYAVFC